MKYSYVKHRTYKIKGIPWLICAGCGLAYLNNNITRWCIKMGCDHEEHPAYLNQLKKAG